MATTTKERKGGYTDTFSYSIHVRKQLRDLQAEIRSEKDKNKLMELRLKEKRLQGRLEGLKAILKRMSPGKVQTADANWMDKEYTFHE